MATFKLIFLLITVNCIWLMAVTSSSISSSYPFTSVHGKNLNSKDESSSVVRRSRQLRCVRCYDNRNTDEYYSRDNRDRYYGSEGTYSSRSLADSRPSAWYQPKQHYDRYDERYGSDRDYDRYSSYGDYYRDRLDNRHTLPRTYDQYNDRGYDRYQDRRYNDERRDSHGYDRYTDDYYRGRKDYGNYYDHVRSASAPGYERRDYYDRDGNYKRYYDDRNYRTLDVSHRQPSAFENSGRGYYFADSERTSIGGNDEFYDSRGAGEDESRYSSLSAGSRPLTKFVNRDPAYLRDHHQSRAPCSRSQSSDCNPSLPSSSSSSSSSAADSRRSRPENSSYPAADNTGGRKSSDSSNTGYSSGWRSSGANTKSSAKQSSSYSGQPSRTLSGSYLLDRDSNTLPEENTYATTTSKSNTDQNSASTSVDNPKSIALTSHIADADINQQATKPTEKY